MRPTMIALAALSLSAGACPGKDIVGAATDAGQFATLLKAADAAGMKATLQGKGPFTVFAPTDAAFQAMPPGALDRLMKPENKAELAKVLGYHVLTGRLTAKDVTGVVSDGAKKAAAVTVINAPLTFSQGAGGLMVNDARIVQADLNADNGIVHVIDKVLAPAVMLQPDH